MQYRPDIDGLRAVAVLSVIFFHAGFAVLSGGYVGVDIFFVISGYLITSIIVKELAKGQFSIVRFYERRARRILPALFTVILFCFPFAFIFFPPEDMKNFAESVIATIFFGSNVLFWLESGYFDTTAELKPLLHTWGLGIEEQYYLLFPALMMLIWRFGLSVVTSTLLIILISSLIAAQLLVYVNQDTAFYLIHTRAWELLIGSIVAIYLHSYRRKDGKFWCYQYGSLAGLVLIIYSILGFSPSTPFPSLYTLAPTLGAAAIILFSRKGTFVYWVLSQKIPVYIGLVSYSFYLWHQPILAFDRYLSLEHKEPISAIPLILLAFLLAVISWKFIETPFRKTNKDRKQEINTRALSVICSSTALGILLVATYFLVFPNATIYAKSHIAEEGLEVVKMASGDSCAYSSSGSGCKAFGGGERTIVVWGDSHAMALMNNLPESMLSEEFKIIAVTHTGCPPIARVIRADRIGNANNCKNNRELEWVQENILALEPEAIFLVGRWTLYLNGNMENGIIQEDSHFLTFNADSRSSIEESRKTVRDGLIKTIERFSDNGFKTYFVEQAPDLQHLSLRYISTQTSTDSEPIKKWHEQEYALIDHIKGEVDVTVLNSKSLFCRGAKCMIQMGGQPLYSDDNHLVGFGATLQWQLIFEQMR